MAPSYMPGPIAAYCAENGGALTCSVVCTGGDDCRSGYACEDAPGTSDPAMPGGPPYQVCVAK